jgi:hypothetical protein
MNLLNGTSRCRRLALLMALSSCAWQFLGFSLPSLVVCYRADRPPQVEFFADSCSCRQAARPSDCSHETPGTPGLEAACTDIRLGAPAAITVGAGRHQSPAGCGRLHPMNERPVAMSGATSPRRPACHRRGSPGASAPPLLAVTPASFRLLC